MSSKFAVEITATKRQMWRYKYGKYFTK